MVVVVVLHMVGIKALVKDHFVRHPQTQHSRRTLNTLSLSFLSPSLTYLLEAQLSKHEFFCTHPCCQQWLGLNFHPRTMRLETGFFPLEICTALKEYQNGQDGCAYCTYFISVGMLAPRRGSTNHTKFSPARFKVNTHCAAFEWIAMAATLSRVFCNWTFSFLNASLQKEVHWLNCAARCHLFFWFETFRPRNMIRILKSIQRSQCLSSVTWFEMWLQPAVPIGLIEEQKAGWGS